MAENKLTPRIKWTWLRTIIYLVFVIGSSAIFQLIAIVILIFLTDLDFAQIANTPKGEIAQTIGMFNFMILNLSGFIGMILFTWGYRKLVDRKSLKSLGFSFSNYKRDFFKGMDWGMAAITVGFLILFAGGILTVDGIQLNLEQLFIAFILFSIVALNEEIMIRGYILGNLSESYNRYIALIASSVLFMLMHLANANLSAIALLNLFLAGILLGVYYIFRRNLWFSIGLHLTWNFFQGPVYGFEVSGVKTQSIIQSSFSGSDYLTGGKFGFEGSLLATLIILIMIFSIHQKYRIETKIDQQHK